MLVLKFGGSSVAKPERIVKVVEILKQYHNEKKAITVVFSAFGGITDKLIKMANLAAKGNSEYLAVLEEFRIRHIKAIEYLLKGDIKEESLKLLHENHKTLANLLQGVTLVYEASPRTMDYVLSFGERNSAFIISKFLQQEGLPGEYLDARNIIKTNKNFGSAKVDFELTNEKIAAHYSSKKGTIQIVTGFIAKDKGGLTTTLGRGGSDYTAAILASGLEAEAIEIWTDVDGVLTADPRKVKTAFTIPSMTYAEAMEMSHFGAKVIYPPTIQPAYKKNIPLYIKNTFNPSFVGTLVSNKNNTAINQVVQGISSISDIALLTLEGGGLFGVPGIAGRLFSALAQEQINIILITQGSSEHSISFAVQPHLADKAKKAIEQVFEFELKNGQVSPVKLEMDLCVVAAIGENMRYRPGIAGQLFEALGNNGINIIAIAQGSSELNISTVIKKEDEQKALNVIHDAFFLSSCKELHIFMIGVGLIGGCLLEQIEQQAEYLKNERGLVLKINGLANSKKMLFNAEGIDLSDWETQLKASKEVMDINLFIKNMSLLNLSNSIFIDNTASATVADAYQQILEHAISISTPNKIAASSSYANYKLLKHTAKNRSVHYMFETNVGAGLPVISTLKDLVDSGDEVLKIEGVLSGSLSYIFNTFDENRPFSEVVQEAKTLGFTEPDPRQDLSGSDVKRKITILAREAGFALEPEDVIIEAFLPESAMDESKSVDAFFDAVKAFDNEMANKAKATTADGKKLRFIASYENGKATISLKAVDQQHPFYSLNGSDNMIVFTTKRYQKYPLVVRGPGAGAAVTSAGVFAEVIRIANNL